MAISDEQWIFSSAELNNTPSIQDGMKPEEEKELRMKGVRFIQQVGILIKAPQITLATAAVFFQRFLMRASLKKPCNGIPKLHHFQIAATALFLALKVEETPRKMRDIIQACCRIAQQNPKLEIDEQSKDYWRWRDTILDNEDILLEILCFDLDIISPHRVLFNMLKQYKLEHNRPLRDAAWAFVLDANSTELCLLFTSSTLAAAALFSACHFCKVTLPDHWIANHARVEDVRAVITFMLGWQSRLSSQTADGAVENGNESTIYTNLVPPPLEGVDEAMQT